MTTHKFSGGSWCRVSVVNALSENLDLTIWRDGKIWRQTYQDETKNKLKL